jgi:hypothetical protein
MSPQALVTIAVKGWSGWTKEQPKSKALQLTVQAGQKLTPASIGIASDEYEIAVNSIGADQMLVSYSGVVMENADGTIPLMAPRQGRCLIKVRHCMRLATATMDAGTSIALTLERVESWVETNLDPAG